MLLRQDFLFAAVCAGSSCELLGILLSLRLMYECEIADTCCRVQLYVPSWHLNSDAQQVLYPLTHFLALNMLKISMFLFNVHECLPACMYV